MALHLYNQFVRQSGFGTAQPSGTAQALGALSGFMDVLIKGQAAKALNDFRERQLTNETTRLNAQISVNAAQQRETARAGAALSEFREATLEQKTEVAAALKERSDVAAGQAGQRFALDVAKFNEQTGLQEAGGPGTPAGKLRVRQYNSFAKRVAQLEAIRDGSPGWTDPDTGKFTLFPGGKRELTSAEETELGETTGILYNQFFNVGGAAFRARHETYLKTLPSPSTSPPPTAPPEQRSAGLFRSRARAETGQPRVTGGGLTIDPSIDVLAQREAVSRGIAGKFVGAQGGKRGDIRKGELRKIADERLKKSEAIFEAAAIQIQKDNPDASIEDIGNEIMSNPRQYGISPDYIDQIRNVIGR